MRPASLLPRADGHGLRNLALVFGAVALGISLGLGAFELRSSLKRQSDRATEAARDVATTLEHELLLREYAVDAMVASAEQLLDGRVRASDEIVDRLAPTTNRDGYVLVAPDGAGPDDPGSLVGEGAIPTRGSPAAAEMAMAYALAPSFRLLQARNLDVPWAYYFSRRGFVYVHPRATDGRVVWSHALLERYTKSYRGGPSMPERGIRSGWSPVYEDEAGKGPMTTLSKLVVHGGDYVGDVSIDLGVSTLTDVLDRHGVAGSTLHLLDWDGAPMSARGLVPSSLDVRAAPRGVAHRAGDAEVTLFDVAPSGWHVAIVTPRRAMLARALRESAVYGGVVLFMLASLALLVALSKALRDLAALSLRDALTGLYNRRHFDEVAESELAKARRGGLRVGLALIDVDHFKKYNDRYGHHAGDQVLRAVATALRTSLRRASDGVFRIGGEEFAVLAYVERPEQMRALGEQLRAAVRALAIPHEDGEAGHVTISLGAITVDADAWVDRDTAYQHADAALYRAKQGGRDSIEVG